MKKIALVFLFLGCTTRVTQKEDVPNDFRCQLKNGSQASDWEFRFEFNKSKDILKFESYLDQKKQWEDVVSSTSYATLKKTIDEAGELNVERFLVSFVKGNGMLLERVSGAKTNSQLFALLTIHPGRLLLYECEKIHFSGQLKEDRQDVVKGNWDLKYQLKLFPLPEIQAPLDKTKTLECLQSGADLRNCVRE
jgi:hypothetical protein